MIGTNAECSPLGWAVHLGLRREPVAASSLRLEEDIIGVPDGFHMPARIRSQCLQHVVRPWQTHTAAPGPSGLDLHPFHEPAVDLRRDQESPLCPQIVEFRLPIWIKRREDLDHSIVALQHHLVDDQRYAAVIRDGKLPQDFLLAEARKLTNHLVLATPRMRLPPQDVRSVPRPPEDEKGKR